MNATKKFFIADIVFWVIFFGTMLVCSQTSHRGMGVVLTPIFFLVGIFFWVKSYFAAQTDEKAVKSFPIFVFQIFFKCLVIVSVAFMLGNYAGTEIITLIASSLVWVYVICAIVKKRPADVVYSIVVLQSVIVWSQHFFID